MTLNADAPALDMHSGACRTLDVKVSCLGRLSRINGPPHDAGKTVHADDLTLGLHLWGISLV